MSSPSLAQQAYYRFEQDKLEQGLAGRRRKEGLRASTMPRLATALAMPPDAVVIVTPTNAFKPTAKFKFRSETAKRATDIAGKAPPLEWPRACSN